MFLIYVANIFCFVIFKVLFVTQLCFLLWYEIYDFLIYGFLAKKDYSKQRWAINTPMVFKFVVSNFTFEVFIHI